ncbi:glycoside hydrolase family 3 protein [Sulfurovum sp. bin170]|uniref:glycoside hydrolase family 3 protein n=1 Tax=Sulfurovum sp. bin170 TaxID=2695268 RepID=UPI002101F86F|nr:glycoside hydrolase family 3 N-terminal domain-containing protein [Sulfurovum sp. bin170]
MKITNLALLVFLALSGCTTEPKMVTPRIDKNAIETLQEDKKKEVLIIEDVVSKTLDEKIGSMLMVGFMGTTAPQGSQICNDIYNYNLAGVILFDVNPVKHSEPKNIDNKEQVRTLTEQLQACSRDGKLLISVDQEGGGVQRLKRKYGFYGKFPKARDVKRKSEVQIRTEYFKMGEELNSVGINYNLAPVVDLAINKRNKIIYKYGRSFGSNPKDVAKYSSIFISAMRNNGVLSAVKHFPGHGSSLGDTHKGFVDVTNLWQKKELEPYRILAEQGAIDTVMVAHVFNKKIDAEYPATLSAKTINGLLRNDIGFDGVVITDDLQMGAIGNYSLRDRLRLTIGAGNDILLFGNQLSVRSMVSTQNLVDTVKEMVDSGEVSLDDIERSNERMEILKQGI